MLFAPLEQGPRIGRTTLGEVVGGRDLLDDQAPVVGGADTQRPGPPEPGGDGQLVEGGGEARLLHDLVEGPLLVGPAPASGQEARGFSNQEVGRLLHRKARQVHGHVDSPGQLVGHVGRQVLERLAVAGREDVLVALVVLQAPAVLVRGRISELQEVDPSQARPFTAASPGRGSGGGRGRGSRCAPVLDPGYPPKRPGGPRQDF